MSPGQGHSERPARTWLSHPDCLLVKRRSGVLAALWLGAGALAYAGRMGAVAVPGFLLLWGVVQWTWGKPPAWGKLLLAAGGAFALCAATTALAVGLKAHARKRAGTYDWSS